MAVVCLMMTTPLVSVAGVYSGSNVISNNIHDHVYTTNSVVSNSYMMTNSDGTITRIENMGDVILYEKYNSSFQLVHQGTIPFELSYFGGCYSGVNYNYLIFGQENPNQDNNLECIRIVKYTKNVNRSRGEMDCRFRYSTFRKIRKQPFSRWEWMHSAK